DLPGIWLHRDRRILGRQCPERQADRFPPRRRRQGWREDRVHLAGVARQGDARVRRSQNARGPASSGLRRNSVRPQAPHPRLLHADPHHGPHVNASALPLQSLPGPMPRLIAELEFEQVSAIVRDLDGALDPVGFARLHGGTSDVYRIDLARAKKPLVLKIYADEPPWIVAKEALVAGWIGERAGLPIPRWLCIDRRRSF